MPKHVIHVSYVFNDGKLCFFLLYYGSDAANADIYLLYILNDYQTLLRTCITELNLT